MLNAIKEKLLSVFWERKRSSQIFMSESLRQRYFGTANKGLVLGELRLTTQDSRENLLMIGPGGSGIAPRFIVPSLLNLEGSAVVIDVEVNNGDKKVFNLTSDYLKAKGYNIKLFQLKDVANSLRFNPLARLKTNKEIQELVEMLRDYHLKLDSEDIKSFLAEEIATVDPSKPDEAKNLEAYLLGKIKRDVKHLIHGVMVALKNFSIEEGNLKNFHFGAVRKIIERLTNTEDVEAREFIKETINLCNGENPYHEYWDKFDPWRWALEPASCRKDRYLERCREVTLKTALLVLDLWSEPDIVDLTSSDNVEIEDLTSKKTVIYIPISEMDMDKYSLIIQLFLLRCFKHCYDNREVEESEQVYYFLNSFDCLTPFPKFALWLHMLRDAKTSISLILNSSEQIRRIYQIDPSNVDACWAYEYGNKIKGFRTRVFLSGVDHHTCKYVEGIVDYRDRTFLAEELRRLPYTQALVICDGMLPILLEIKGFCEDKKLNQLLEQQ